MRSVWHRSSRLSSSAALGFAAPRWPLLAAFVAAVMVSSCDSSGGGGSSAGAGAGPGPGPGPGPAAFNIVATTPVDGAIGVGRLTAIEVVFSADVDESTLSGDSFTVTGTTSGVIGGVFSYINSERRVVFAPAAIYAYEETIRVELSAELKSADGVALAETEFSFTVEEEPPPPPPGTIVTVEETTPVSYARDAASNEQITVRFSDPLDLATVGIGTVAVRSSTRGRIPVVLSTQDGRRRLVLGPTTPYHAGEEITIELSSALRFDTADDATFDGFVFSFRVATRAVDLTKLKTAVTSVAGTVAGVLPIDVNLDGDIDLVYRLENGSTIHFLLGDGDGGFTDAGSVDQQQTILSLAVADTDQDSDLDLVVGTSDRVHIFLNRASNGPADAAQFDSGPELVLDSAVRGLCIGDLDHSGGPDYVFDTERGLEVRLGSLTADPIQTFGDLRQSRTGLALRDLDLDGQLDLAYGDPTGDRLLIHFGTIPDPEDAEAPYPLADAVSIDLPSSAEQIAVDRVIGAESDVLARPEILVLTTDGASLLGNALKVLRDDGQDGYVVEDFAVGDVDPGGGGDGGAASLDNGRFTLADLAGDGVLDVVLGSIALDRVVLLENRAGEIVDAAGTNLVEAPDPWIVQTADLTGDGGQEIIVAAMNELHILAVDDSDPPPPPPETFSLSVSDTEVKQGESGAVLVRMTNSLPLDAYVVLVGYDANVLSPTDASFEGTVTATAAPEFTEFDIQSEHSAVAITALVEFTPPFEARTLPVSSNEPLLRFMFDVLEDAPVGPATIDILAEIPTNTTALVSGGENKTPTTQSGTLTVTKRDDPPPPNNPNRMWIGDTGILAGESGLVPVFGASETKVDAFTTIVEFDPERFEAVDTHLEGTDTEMFSPELVVPTIRDDHVVFTVIFDFTSPFDRQGIPPGDQFHLVDIELRVRGGTRDGAYPIRFIDNVGTPPLFNIFAFGGSSVFPALTNGEVRVTGTGEVLFLRGDANVDSSRDISDAIFIMEYLFQSGETPPCFDAADVDDDGRVNVSDAIALLTYIFQGTVTPAEPFMEPGTDPTADDLDCQQSL